MSRTSIPILMYHKVGAPVAEKRDRFLNVPARSFERQMRLLARLGYNGITFERAIQGLFLGAPLPRRPICVTFDDGYVNVAEHGAPVLESLGWPGTVFVPTAYMGGCNAWDEKEGRPILPILGWDGLRQLQDAGWEMAGHTRSHPRLADLNDPQAIEELTSSREAMERELGQAPRTFCYPFGSVGPRTPRLVRGAGFIGACTTASGLAQSTGDAFLLPRVKVAYRDGLAGLLYRLWIRPKLP